MAGVERLQFKYFEGTLNLFQKILEISGIDEKNSHELAKDYVLEIVHGLCDRLEFDFSIDTQPDDLMKSLLSKFPPDQVMTEYRLSQTQVQDTFMKHHGAYLQDITPEEREEIVNLAAFNIEKELKK